MSAQLKPQSSPTADREILTSRLYDAPREMVFKAWSDPKKLAQWWGPRGFSTTTHAMDFRSGGEWRLTMHGPDGRDYENRVLYIEILAPERIVYTHSGAENSDDPIKFISTITFEDQGGKTLLTMRGVFDTAEAMQEVVEKYNAKEGGKQTLERLAEYLQSL
jgi:uncharacterized protein YndB with AHSA1/START domain